MLHGVKLAAGKDGGVSATALSWPLRQPGSGDTPSDNSAGESAAAARDDAVAAMEAPPLAEVLRLARSALRIEQGCALALPTERLIVRVLALPPADTASLGDIVRLQMEKIAPCAGDDLSVGFEVLAQEADQVRVFAAAIPQAALDVLARQVSDAGLRLTRLDAALCGWWRQLHDSAPPVLGQAVCAVLFREGDNWDFILSDKGECRAARGLGTQHEAGDLGRELTLSLLNLEMESGAATVLDSVLVVGDTDPGAEWKTTFAASLGAGGLTPSWINRADLGAPGLGCARREGEEGRIDLVPYAWRSHELGQRKRRRLAAAFGAAFGLWLLLLAAMLLAPAVVGRQTAAVNARLAAEEGDYRRVSDVRLRVRLIRSYMDRSQSVLEVLRQICTVMPEGMVFNSITYRHGDVVRFAGDADQAARVYALKDELDNAEGFESTRLTGPTLDAVRQRHRFEIEARFPTEAE